jgi:hypothetical protein
MAADTATPEYPATTTTATAPGAGSSAAGSSYVFAEAPASTPAPRPAPVRTPAQRRWIIAAIAVATAIVLCGIFVSGVFLGLTVAGGPTTSQQQQFPGQPGGGQGFGGNR